MPAIQQRQAAEAVTVPRAAATVQETAVHETADTDQEAAIAEATAATVQEKAVPEAVTEVDAVTVEATAQGTAVQGADSGDIAMTEMVQIPKVTVRHQVMAETVMPQEADTVQETVLLVAAIAEVTAQEAGPHTAALAEAVTNLEAAGTAVREDNAVYLRLVFN